MLEAKSAASSLEPSEEYMEGMEMPQTLLAAACVGRHGGYQCGVDAS